MAEEITEQVCKLGLLELECPTAVCSMLNYCSDLNEEGE
jgi:hypothetical protein